MVTFLAVALVLLALVVCVRGWWPVPALQRRRPLVSTLLVLVGAWVAFSLLVVPFCVSDGWEADRCSLVGIVTWASRGAAFAALLWAFWVFGNNDEAV